MTGYLTLVQLALYASGAFVLYRVVRRFVVHRRIGAFAASACYWVVLALAPSAIALAVGRIGNYIYSNDVVMADAGWDIGLAMWLLVGIWACYLVGLMAASFVTWRLVQVARGDVGAQEIQSLHRAGDFRHVEHASERHSYRTGEAVGGAMQTNTAAPKSLPSLMQRLALAGMLSLFVALSLALVIPLFKPGFFGSNFEGSAGYMAAFLFTPAVTIVLFPILALTLRKASQLVCLGLWLLVLLVPGFFFSISFLNTGW